MFVTVLYLLLVAGSFVAFEPWAIAATAVVDISFITAAVYMGRRETPPGPDDI